MTCEQETKPLYILWSKLAVESTTMKKLIYLENKFRKDANDIVSQAVGWFFHCFHDDDETKDNNLVYRCIGYEEADRWYIGIRLATYKMISSTSNNGSNSDLEKTCDTRFPYEIQDPDNNLFSTINDLMADDSPKR